MSKYDDLFAEVTAEESLFLEKGALDPLAEPDEIHARDDQEHELASLLAGVHEGDVAPTVSSSGPPGTARRCRPGGSVRSSPRATTRSPSGA